MIRQADPSDDVVTWDIYRDAVMNGTGAFYTDAQARAWVGPDDACPDWWRKRMEAGATWISQTGATAQGFITLAPPAHLDFFFIRPDARGSGLASALYEALIAEADRRGLGDLTTFASHYARRVLEPRGWEVTERQDVERGGEILTRFAMTLCRD